MYVYNQLRSSGGSSAWPVLPEPRAGALPCTGPEGSARFLWPGRRAQELAAAWLLFFLLHGRSLTSMRVSWVHFLL